MFTLVCILLTIVAVALGAMSMAAYLLKKSLDQVKVYAQDSADVVVLQEKTIMSQNEEIDALAGQLLDEQSSAKKVIEQDQMIKDLQRQLTDAHTMVVMLVNKREEPKIEYSLSVEAFKEQGLDLTTPPHNEHNFGRVYLSPEPEEKEA